jgi:hypothetical protein
VNLRQSPALDTSSLGYRESLGPAFSELLADQFSELTRKRQQALLVAATATLLLAAGLVTKAGEIDLFLKVTLELSVAKWLAFVVTVYMLVTYLLGSSADLALANSKKAFSASRNRQNTERL